jgi:ATP-dependent helicase/nuclease subunit B
MPNAPKMKEAFVSPSASARIARATTWLGERSPSEQILIVAANREAAAEIVRQAVLDSEIGASFGWNRVTAGRLAAEIADDVVVEKKLVAITRFATDGLMARVIQDLRASRSVGRYAGVAQDPGFARAVAATIEELRLGLISAERVDQEAPGLAAMGVKYGTALASARLADRALLYEIATRRLKAGESHPWIGLPILLLDVAIDSTAEAEFLAALTERASRTFATVPSGDDRTLERLKTAGFAVEVYSPPGANGLARLQAHVFEGSLPAKGDLGDGILLFSAPGESRECVEIARRLLNHAQKSMPFDRMAVLLRSVEEYRPHLEEAFDRAGIPAYFARGTIRPDPTGRAFVALLTCAAEGLSARRFTEYLSLGEVPERTATGEPPAASPSEDRWIAPDENLVPDAVADARGEGGGQSGEERSDSTDGSPPADDVPAPRRWEQLLVDSAVIGGLGRWSRRLDGLAREIELDLEEFDDPDDPTAQLLRRRLKELASLRAFALPLLTELSDLPERALWGEWLDPLSSLATRALQRPERVLAVLSELIPMAEVGPVDLREVRLVLARRLLEVAVPPPKSRSGRVFVSTPEGARGLAFDVVCVPGLAEKLFPRQIREDPILLDRSRVGINEALLTNDDRVLRERLALRLAVGAARRHLVLSYPRLDLEKGRPRVPSFYALETVRASEGRLPGFDELAARAEQVVHTRVGWPAPRLPQEAIDEAEHDLALLSSIFQRSQADSVGMARYLLTANPHLGRALRFRPRRWLRRWTPADGLVDPGPAAKAALAAHRLDARSYSPTALEHYSACPYRFLLQAIHRLTPREVPEAIEEMSPMQRGSLVHEIQFHLFRRLEAEGLLPVTPANLDAVRDVLEAVIGEVAERFREDLAPAIERVWEAGIEGVRSDLREWLRKMSEDDSGYVPWRFELAFGLSGRRKRDRHSQLEPVELNAGMKLRGSIDLVERDGRGRLRVTDHKTGSVRYKQGEVIAGGNMLQPVFYALAVEKLAPGAEVTEGRLSYCTVNGGFEVRSVPLDAAARDAAKAVTEAVGKAVEEGFLPALPAPRACQFCDYAVVCGPYEELRTRRKPSNRASFETLQRLREMP